ncbi:hypothetical protein ZIOFF_025025 [Zingiber officinale]|uniref:Uncharacterized protein n=1 Tax=Zingiber officinale TaxID=94328 RepID=A0A8J5H156_ZINOF|nr:hypothetical protein ZIOFF_025025 [Zingiber officinale]
MHSFHCGGTAHRAMRPACTSFRHRHCLSFVSFSREYAYTLKMDEKSVVYSFRVVLLELVTGRMLVGELGVGVDIVQWARISFFVIMDDVANLLDLTIADTLTQIVGSTKFVGSDDS